MCGERHRRHRPARRRPAHDAQDRLAARAATRARSSTRSCSASLAGAVVVVPAFNLLIPDPIGARQRRLAGAVVPRVGGRLEGVRRRARRARRARAKSAIAAGLLLGSSLALLERFAPRRAQGRDVPSPSGLGIAMVIPGSNAIAMFLGALRRRAAAPAAARRSRPTSRPRRLRVDRRREPDGRADRVLKVSGLLPM